MPRIKHGMHKSPEYTCWQSMLYRCRNKSHKAWRNYGGRGIKVCKRWHDFSNFYTDMGPRPPGTMLDRIDNNGGYEPGNCRWVSFVSQQMNKRTNVYVTYLGETRCITDWARKFNISPKTLFNRYYRRGMMPPELFHKPREHIKPITIGMETKTLKEWARLRGISYNTVISRIHHQGLPPIEALGL